MVSIVFVYGCVMRRYHTLAVKLIKKIKDLLHTEILREGIFNVYFVCVCIAIVRRLSFQGSIRFND